MAEVKVIRFSVVIPAYNAARTIVAAVRSCLAQSLPPYEVIVVNDYSSDATEQTILQQLGNSVKYISLEQNMGASAARNAGIKLATGDYIAFHDADDTMHPDKLLRMSRELMGRPEVKFIFHPYTLSSLHNIDALSEEYQLVQFPLRKLLLSNPVGTPCIIVSNAEKLYFNDALRYMEDYDYALRAADKYGIYYFSAPLLQVHRAVLSAGGLSSARWKMRKGEIKVYYLLAKRSPGFFLLLPALVGLSLAKHFVKYFLKK